MSKKNDKSRKRESKEAEAKEEEAREAEVREEEGAAPVLSEEEISERDKVDELLDEGYTPRQIEKEWGIPHSTVHPVAKKRIKPKGKQPSDEEATNLPVLLKAGSGREVISPEAILRAYLTADGPAGEWMMKGFMLYRAAQLAVMTDVEIMKGQAEAQAKAMEPIMQMMEKAREDMDAAAQRAKESTMEAAAAAAGEAAARATYHIDQRFDEFMRQKPDIAQTPKPLQGLMARTMEMVFNQLVGQMFGGQVGPTPGMIDKRGQGGR
ncbi:MAG: hypothetical protein ACE5LQ_04975 [Candidatus Bipolaricaulia bacterium]